MSEEIRPDLSHALDLISAPYGGTPADRPGQIAAVNWVLEHLSTGHRPIVLDVGCGTGQPTAEMLVAAGCDVIGIDPSPVLLDIARHNVPDAIFVERDHTELDGLHPIDTRFDAVTAFFSLLVLPRPDVARALDAIHRVLRPGSPFAVGMVEGDTDYLLREFLGTRVPLTAYPRDQLAALLARHGFEVVALSAEPFVSADPDAADQTHLYALCLARAPATSPAAAESG